MIHHIYELYVGRVIGVYADYIELLFCLEFGSYIFKYDGNSLYVSLCRHFIIFKENISSTF